MKLGYFWQHMREGPFKRDEEAQLCRTVRFKGTFLRIVIMTQLRSSTAGFHIPDFCHPFMSTFRHRHHVAR
jgi:hypothetical protein